MKRARLKAYFKNIQSIKAAYTGHLEIYAGLEIDFIPGLMGPREFNDFDVDFTIGSIHFLGEFDDGRHWEIDGDYELFLEGLEKIYEGDIEEVIKQYFSRTRDMVEQSCPDIIGHFDKIKMQNKGGVHFSESASWYQEEVMHTLEVIARSNAIIEVNTRALYQNISEEPYPSLWVLDQMKALNIPITLNSDAHRPEEITEHFSEAAELLMNCGYEEVRVLLRNQWVDVGFNENGLCV